jgi:CRISPR-associated protein Cmr1
MRRERFDVELVTPCFLGGAEGSAEWRAASIRGQLRWWFRAVAGATLALEEVRKTETELFGDTGRSSAVRIRAFEGEGLAPVSLDPSTSRLSAAELARRWGDRSPETESRLLLKSHRTGDEAPSNPIHYLAFGPIAQGEVKRPYLPAGAKAAFELVWIRHVSDDARTLFRQSLWAWLHLGGIGSRSRKGFGSLRLLSGPDFSVPQSRPELLAQMKETLPSAGDGKAGPPDWTCFSAGSRIFLGREDHGSWTDALVTLGSWLIGFRRRYGNKAKETRITRSGVSLRDRDYEWAAPSGGSPRAGFPDRAGFGLPLPFKRKSPAGTFKGETVGWASPDGDARRASPLLLHVERLGNSKHVPVITYLPARFLPNGSKLTFEGRRDTSLPTAMQLDIVDRFLEHLLAPPSGPALIEEVPP